MACVKYLFAIPDSIEVTQADTALCEASILAHDVTGAGRWAAVYA